MPTPYDYNLAQPNVGSYFEAMRQGRADRLTAENDQKMSALSKYLPGALNGDEEARGLALQAAPVDQMAGLKQTFAGVDQQKIAKAREVNGQLASLAMWADSPDKWPIALAEARKISPDIGDIPFEQRGAIIAKFQTVSEQLEAAYKQQMLANDTSRTTAQNAASYASAAASRALAGQRTTGGATRPMASGPQKAEDDDIGAIQTTQSIDNQLAAIDDQVSGGKLSLGPVNNFLSEAQNWAGASNAGSINYSTMKSTLEKMRNDSLRLNNGVQTEGDAIRAWNELMSNVNDPGVVRAQIKRIRHLNGLAAQQKKQLINIRRQRNGMPPLDFSTLSAPVPTAGPQGAPAVGGAPPGDVNFTFDPETGDLVEVR